MAASRLFTPISVGGLALKNRLVLAAMGTAYAERGGLVSDRLIAYLARRARGGVGLVVTEAAAVDESGAPFPAVLRADDDRCLPGLARLAKAVKAEGAAVALQIYHAGRQMSERVSGRQPVAPSPVPCPMVRAMPRPLTAEEIETLIERFAQAAARAKAAGFDAVEFNGGHGYLLHQFLSPLSNRRDDHWGGDAARRQRFALEVVRRVRGGVGPGFPLIYKISAEDGLPGGLTFLDTLEIARRLEAAGINALVASAGTYGSFEQIVQPITEPEGCLRGWAASFKRELKIPVIAVGRITSPETAESILEHGEADLVALGRALLADPDWPQKAHEGRHRDIRPCITCNECLTRLFRAEPIRCAVNPEAGREGAFPAPRAAKPKRVVVVGGGPAGMQAAVVAAGRGHSVTLLEARDRLGGQLPAASRIRYKRSMGHLAEYLASRLAAAGVDARCGAAADVHAIRALNPDVVVVATGPRPIIPSIPGIDAPWVRPVWDVLSARLKAPGPAVVLAGETRVACEAALMLAERGLDVTLLAPGKELARDAETVTRKALLTLLERAGVRMRTGLSVDRLGGHQVFARDEAGGEISLTARLVVVIPRLDADNGLRETLERAGLAVRPVGDCAEPGGVVGAIHSATDAALGL
ncbi:MAG TPA: FAD-dependent oxidoreductase [Methylomirabilota bacterium]|nr:FAD-dependent oxidoreductase [Methylomirabilota bacterium]